jgi:transposase
MSEEELQLEGPVEMDETYFGGQRRVGNRVPGSPRKTGRPGYGDSKKTAIVGIVERRGRVVAKTAAHTGSAILLGMVKEHVLPETTIYTDEYMPYRGIGKMGRGYEHKRIHHSAKVYVVGDIHTNTVEGFWSLIKRGIGGVYHAVSQKYLQTYLDEYSYRYNRRDQGNLIFKSILGEVSRQARGK